MARHIASFLQQSAPLLRRSHLPMPALIYSLALSCTTPHLLGRHLLLLTFVLPGERYRPVVIPILVANIEHLLEPKQVPHNTTVN